MRALRWFILVNALTVRTAADNVTVKANTVTPTVFSIAVLVIPPIMVNNTLKIPQPSNILFRRFIILNDFIRPKRPPISLITKINGGM